MSGVFTNISMQTEYLVFQAFYYGPLTLIWISQIFWVIYIQPVIYHDVAEMFSVLEKEKMK